MSEHPPELVEKVARAICAARTGDHLDAWEVTAARGREDYRAEARAALDAIGLELETQTNVPVSVPTVDAGGQPVMNDCGHQHHHIDWIDRERLVTPWVETRRVTGEQMRQRMDARAAEVAERMQAQ